MNEQDELTTHTPESWQEPPVMEPSPRGSLFRRAFKFKVPGWIMFVIVVLLAAQMIPLVAKLRSYNAQANPRAAQSTGPFWKYEFVDFTSETHHSAQMSVYEDGEVRKHFDQIGNRGGELVAVIPRVSKYPSADRIEYRAIFKRRSENESHIPEFDAKEFDKAQAAETKARDAELQRTLDRMRRP
jgi:hypothetical protein